MEVKGETCLSPPPFPKKEGKMILRTQSGKVFSLENDSKTIIAEIQNAGITNLYKCTLLCCNNPVCTCGSVNISFFPQDNVLQDNPTLPYQVDIDIVDKKLAYKDEKKVSIENLTFAKLLISSLDEADFEFLWKSHFSYKNEITEKADIETIKADFDFQEIEENGLLYAYNDVLPYGNPLHVHIKGETYLIYDQYCLLPKCSCTDATLTFFSDKELDKTGQELFSIALNYKKKQWTEVERNAVTVDARAVRSAMEDQIPDIYKQLLNRHIKLKGIYAHCKKRHFKQQLKLPIVGRNDPCPCGSGKKYKKCCM
jgi:uncharacterized protein YchJ